VKYAKEKFFFYVSVNKFCGLKHQLISLNQLAILENINIKEYNLNKISVQDNFTKRYNLLFQIMKQIMH